MWDSHLLSASLCGCLQGLFYQSTGCKVEEIHIFSSMLLGFASAVSDCQFNIVAVRFLFWTAESPFQRSTSTIKIIVSWKQCKIARVVKCVFFQREFGEGLKGHSFFHDKSRIRTAGKMRNPRFSAAQAPSKILVSRKQCKIARVQGFSKEDLVKVLKDIRFFMTNQQYERHAKWTSR